MSNILHSQEISADAPVVLSHLSANIRRLRKAKNISQQDLADKAMVSRRMINAIENNKANVSLSTVDRLAAALGVNFTELVREPKADNSARINALAWRGAYAGSEATLLGAAPGAKETELWTWSLAHGERYRSEDESQNWHEMILVLEGVLTLEMTSGVRNMKSGDFVVFSDPGPYIFSNAGSSVVRFVRNIVL